MAKRMKPTSTKPTLFSDDITIEVFSRLPVKSLMRFKSLSTSFNSLILKSYLMDMHQHRSMSNHPDEIKFFVPESEGFCSIKMKKDGEAVFRCNLDFLYHHFSYSNGLFCFWVEELESVRIFNPGTREIRLLPRVRKLYPLRCLRESYLSAFYGCSYLLGYEPEEKKYKVLMTLGISIECTRNWIFTLGTDKHWREIERMTFFQYPRREDYKHIRGICISGVIYMFDCLKSFIVAFDLKAENFKIITLWSGNHEWIHNYELIEVKGKLAVRDWSFKYVKLRILGDTQPDEWQIHIIHFPAHLPIYAYRIFSSCNGESLIFLVRLHKRHNVWWSCYCYDVRKDNWKHLKILPSAKDWIDKGICNYVENLFPLKEIGSAHNRR